MPAQGCSMGRQCHPCLPCPCHPTATPRSLPGLFPSPALSVGAAGPKLCCTERFSSLLWPSSRHVDFLPCRAQESSGWKQPCIHPCPAKAPFPWKSWRSILCIPCPALSASPQPWACLPQLPLLPCAQAQGFPSFLWSALFPWHPFGSVPMPWWLQLIPAQGNARLQLLFPLFSLSCPQPLPRSAFPCCPSRVIHSPPVSSALFLTIPRKTGSWLLISRLDHKEPGLWSWVPFWFILLQYLFITHELHYV